MHYSWDPEKSRKNTRKHGYSFEQIYALDWDLTICVDAQIVGGEERELWIGPVINNLVVVVIVEASSADIRVISMRGATNPEIARWKKEVQGE